MDQVTINRQQRVILTFLREHPAGVTRLQIARGVWIERATICRRVAELRDKQLVCVGRRDLDPLTNTKAEFLITNTIRKLFKK